MKLMLKFLFVIIFSIVFTGCAIFTETIVVEKPTYIDRPLPNLKKYDVNSTFKFTGLINDGNYTKVPKQQLKNYINIKIELEKQLEKSNDQIDFYYNMVTKPIK